MYGKAGGIRSGYGWGRTITNDERSHVQHIIRGIEVSPDGPVYDEGVNVIGHAISFFKDGDLESNFIPNANGSDNGWKWVR